MIYHLTLSTFAGYAPGATHWHARLRYVDPQATGWNHIVEVDIGEPSYGRYASKQAAIAGARRVYKKTATKKDLLLLSDISTCGPKVVLEGPEEVKVAAAALYEHAEKIGWWDTKTSSLIMEGIEVGWDKLVKPFEGRAP